MNELHTDADLHTDTDADPRLCERLQKRKTRSHKL